MMQLHALTKRWTGLFTSKRHAPALRSRLHTKRTARCPQTRRRQSSSSLITTKYAQPLPAFLLLEESLAPALRGSKKRSIFQTLTFMHITWKRNIDHAEEIIACKEFYNVKLDDFGCSFAYSGRSAPVTLGELLQHYKGGNMTQPCPSLSLS